MTEPRTERDLVDQLFDALCDLPAEEREAELERACDDPAVRTLVRRLLAYYDAPPSELAEPRLSAADVQEASAPRHIGPYEILEVLGSGAMGVVYRARQSSPSREVAVKVLRSVVQSESAAQRFAREAELLGRFRHPGIATIYESGVADVQGSRMAYIAMELIAGRPLTACASEGESSIAERVRLLAECADAVHHAHLRGVIHRDLKPSNVLLDEEGRVRVIDFGVARTLDPEGAASQQTRAGQVVGTLAYMSPEQVRGELDAVDARADVYALGALSYELLSGAVPFELEDTTLADAADTIALVDPKPLGARAPECAGDLEWIVARALAKEPERRYQSADALAADLRRWLAHEPVEARPPSWVYLAQRFARRHRAFVAAASVGGLALLIGASVATYLAIANGRLATRASEAQERAELESQRSEERALEAERLRALAEERAAEIVRRSDPDLLARAVREADELWPAVPRMIPAMDAWLRESGEPLAQSLEVHRATLLEWRELAEPYTEERAAQDRAADPRSAELERLRTEREQARGLLRGEHGLVPLSDEDSVAVSAEALESFEQSIAQLEEALAQQLSWQFADAELQSAHDNLQRLVGDLEQFVNGERGALHMVRRRREIARELAVRTLEEPVAVAAWEAATRAIAASPHYGGLELAPQVGLLPLGADARSGLWEFWHVSSGEQPRPASDAQATSPWELDEAQGIVLVLIPGGRATVGAQAQNPAAPHYDPLAQPLEGPVVELETPPYFLSKYELTIQQWMRVSPDLPNGYPFSFRWYGEPPAPAPHHINTRWNPVERMSWLDATRVLRQLDLRLPSAIEWEIGARGGTSTPWWSGAEPSSLASIDGGLPAENLADALTRARGGPDFFHYESWEDEWLVHAPVGSFPPNPYGLHDVLGNVYEFCADRNLPGAGQDVVLVRGGAYGRNAAGSRVTNRNYMFETEGAELIGIRPARSVDLGD